VEGLEVIFFGIGCAEMAFKALETTREWVDERKD
jgi:hypothetical protein